MLVVINPLSEPFIQPAVLFLVLFCVSIPACKAYRILQKRPSVRLDEEMVIVPGAFNKSREEASNTADVEESPDERVKQWPGKWRVFLLSVLQCG